MKTDFLDLNRDHELYRTVVGSVDIGADRAGFEVGGEAFGGQPVVEPPSDVFFSRGSASAHGPPSVFAGAFVKMAEDIDQAGAEMLAEAGALFIAEPCVFAVGLGIGEVNFLVGAVEIAANEHGSLFFELLHIGPKGLIPSEAVG